MQVHVQRAVTMPVRPPAVAPRAYASPSTRATTPSTARLRPWSNAIRYRSRYGTVSTRCRTGTHGSTASTR